MPWKCMEFWKRHILNVSIINIKFDLSKMILWVCLVTQVM